jgi:hypothetical protein
MTPAIRGWFDEAGCHPVEFVSPGPNSFAVGCERLTDVLDVSPLPTRLFTFVDSA